MAQAASTIRVRIGVNWGKLEPGLRPTLEALRSDLLDELRDAIEERAPSRVTVRRTRLADVVVEGPAVPIEFGTRPGYFPNVTSLYETWGAARGKTFQEMWAVATHISRHGTPARPFVFPALESLPTSRILTTRWEAYFRIGLRRGP